MKQPTSYLKLKAYFEKLVENSHFLEDFVGYFDRELHNKRTSTKGIKSPALVLFNYSLGLEGEDTAVSSAVRNLNFGIIYTNVNSGNFEGQYEAIDKAESLAMKVASRLRYDSNRAEHFLYGALIKNSIEVRPIELGGGGIFGVEVAFQLKNIQTLKLNPDDWQDIDKVC